MPRNGSGTYSPPAGQPVVSGTPISSSVFNALVADLGTEFTRSIAKDGQTPMAANLPMGGFKIVNLAPGTVATDAAQLGQLTASSGSSVFGFIQSGSGSVARTGQDKLRDFVNVRDKGALGDGTDQTSAISAAAAHKVVYVPAGTYVIDTINISASVTFVCEPGAIFQRKAGADISQAGYLSMTGMFVVNTNGVTLRFTGSPTFDGNYTAQTATEPGG